MSRELFYQWACSSYFHAAASEAKSQNAILVNIGLTNCAGHRDITSGIEFHCYDSNWANDDETNTISSIFFRGYFPGCAHQRSVLRQSKQSLYCVRASERGRWKQGVSMKRIDALPAGWLCGARKNFAAALTVYRKQFARLSRQAHYSERRAPAAFRLHRTRPQTQRAVKEIVTHQAFLPNCLFIKFGLRGQKSPSERCQCEISRRLSKSRFGAFAFLSRGRLFWGKHFAY